MTSEAILQPFPSTPPDLLEDIMFFCLYDGPEFSPFIPYSDFIGVSSAQRERRAEFARSFLTVAKDISVAAAKLLWRTIIISTPQELPMTTHAASQARGGHLNQWHLGDVCRRMEIRTPSAYSPDQLGKLLHHTPDLEVLILRTHHSSRCDPTPMSIDGLIACLPYHTPNLRRLQFESVKEYATPLVIKKALEGLPKLTSLRAARFHTDEDGVQPRDVAIAATSTLPELQELSIGSGPRRPRSSPLFRDAGDLALVIPLPSITPNLVSLHLQAPNPAIRDLLRKFGGQLTTLGVSSADAYTIGAENGYPHLLSLCPQLQCLVCVVVEGSPREMFDQLPPTPTIQEIVLVFQPQLVTTTCGGVAILRHAMSTIDRARFAALRTVVVATAPPFAFVYQAAWFQDARQRLLNEGVEIPTRLGTRCSP